MVTTFMISPKTATEGLLKKKIFWNKSYGVIASVQDVTNKILSGESIYIVDVIVWPLFDNSRISITEVITTSIL